MQSQITTKPISDILQLECNEFGVEFYSYLTVKKISNESMNEIEEASYLIISMLLDIEMEGFVDLFCQQYSLRECSIVEMYLRHLELTKLADLFAEAKDIFVGGNQHITEEEYQNVDPFDGDKRWQRFDAIGNEILNPESEIYLIGERIYDWVQSNSEQLLNPR